ncbi:MAG: tetratricopeptide repeat protein [Ignavibacteriae bacterium]|nr:tetratricopeptide repeat protein [Ignavibacteriota bacterium]
MKNFLHEIKERKVRKILAIYISACITTLGLVHLFSFRYNLPSYLFDYLLIFLIYGILSTIIFAWYHGEVGKQKFKNIEYFLHFTVIVFALLTFYFFIQKGPAKLLHKNAKIVAVLPFSNITASKEDEYFCDGITEDILTQLSKIAELKVISRTSVIKYKNTDLSIKEIAEELGAGTILEGSIRRIANKVRITGQLINANDDEHLWAETYDRKIDDIFEVQADIATRIAKELEAKLAPKEKLLIETKPTNNVEAYAYVLRGRELVEKLTNEDNEQGINYYKKALKLDPNYALAFACIASAYDQKVRRYFYSSDWQDSAMAYSKKALQIDKNLSEGHSSLAKSYEAKGDFNLAKYHYEEAIRLNPNSAASIYNLGVLYYNKGNLVEAYNLVSKSIVLKPNDIFGYIVIGGIYRKFGCDKLALKWFENALDIDPESRMVLLYAIENFILTKDFNNADKYFKRLISLFPNSVHTLFLGGKLELAKKNYTQSKKYFEQSFKLVNSDYEYQYGYILLKLKQNKAGEEIINKELNLYLEDEKEYPKNSQLNAKIIADIYSILDEKEKSLKWLNEAIDRGYTEYKEMIVYPYLENINETIEFKRTIGKMKIKIDSMKIVAKGLNSNFKNCEE